MFRRPRTRRPTHARLVWTAAALCVALVVAAASLGMLAWETTKQTFLQRVLDANLDVAQVLASHLADQWGEESEPQALEDLRRYWVETERFYEGSMQVVGPGRRVLFDSRDRWEVGSVVTGGPVEPGASQTIEDLVASGEDWAGIRQIQGEGQDVLAIANVPGQDAIVAVRVPYATVRAEVWDAVYPWAAALGLISFVGGPLSLLLLHRAYRLSTAETARAEAATARYAARLRTLQRVDRAMLAAGSEEAVASAALGGVVSVMPVRTAWVCVQGSQRVASIPPDAGPCPPPGASVVRVPLRADEEVEGELVVDVPTADALEEEQRDVLSEVADVLALSLRQARLYRQAAQSAEILGERVRERTVELQEVVRELEGFNYTVAHDLRAPLRAMAGLADVVRAEEGPKLGARSVEFLDGISRSAQRLDRLVTDLLSYARIGRDEALAGPVDLDEAVKLAVEQVGAEAGVPGAVFTVERPLPRVVAVPTLLGQVLVNLLSNAVKFVPEGRRPEVTVRARRVRDRVRVEVRDNGPGVDESHRERIFRVFERLRADAPGTGVGLAIVRRAVERMGGVVGVEGGASGGSVFWFTLPSAEAKHEPAEDRPPRGG